MRTLPSGQRRSRLSTLRSQTPLMLRHTLAKMTEPWAAGAPDIARVCLAAGAAGPVGGDQLTLEVEVGEGSALVLTEVSPTLLLPGAHGEQSCTTVRIHVRAGGTLVWLPEPVIAANGCDHTNDVRVELDEDARLCMREELLLGRHGENAGTLRQRVRVRRGGAPVYRQDLDVGTRATTTPAVLGAHRAVGSVIVVDPDWEARPPEACNLPGEAAMLPLAAPAAVLVTALAPDNLALRRQLEAGLCALGPPWAPRL